MKTDALELTRFPRITLRGKELIIFGTECMHWIRLFSPTDSFIV